MRTSQNATPITCPIRRIHRELLRYHLCGYFLPHRAIPVYMYLKDRSGSTGSCWPGIKTIAKALNLSRSTVKRALTDLEQHGYLAKLPRYRPNGSNTSNLYTLL